MRTVNKCRLCLAATIAGFFLFCFVLSLVLGCAAQRHTLEVYWPPSESSASWLVIQWPDGVVADSVISSDYADPVTGTTRTISTAPWTAPPEPD